MSELNASNLRKEHGNEGPDLVGTTELTSPYFMVPPSGTTKERPENPQPGTLRFNTDIGSLEYFKGDTIGWESINRTTPNLDGGARAINIGGAGPVNEMTYFTIATLGDAQDFGDMATARYLHGSCSSRTRGLSGGGNIPESNNIEYITIPSLGNGTSFGDLTSVKRNLQGGGNQTRGIFAGGLEPGPTYTDDIEYVTIAQLGNSIDFGNFSVSRIDSPTVSNGTRMVTFAGSVPSPTSGVNTMDYITIASTGNATDFGDTLEVTDARAASGCSATRGVFMGGRLQPSGTTVNTIQYITIATLGNSTDFGDLTAAKRTGSGTSDKVRAVMIGGYNAGPSGNNVIEYIQIATTGNALDFGDLPSNRYSFTSISNAHGGI